MGLYSHAEGAAGAEDVVLLIFGHGKKPKVGKQENAKEGEAEYEAVRDNGDGTWTAVLRNAQVQATAVWEKMCGTQKDKNADNRSVVTDNRSVHTAGNRTADNRTVDKRSAVDNMSVPISRYDQATYGDRTEGGTQGAGGLADIMSPKKHVVAPREDTVIMANFGDVQVNDIDRIVVASAKDFDAASRRVDDDRSVQWRPSKNDEYQKWMSQMVEVQEMDTFAHGKFDAFVMDNDMENSVFANQQYGYATDDPNAGAKRKSSKTELSLPVPTIPEAPSPVSRRSDNDRDAIDVFKAMSPMSHGSAKSLDFFSNADSPRRGPQVVSESGSALNVSSVVNMSRPTHDTRGVAQSAH